MKDRQTRQPVAGTVQANGWSLPQKGTGILFAGMMRSLYSKAIIPNDVGGLDISRHTHTVTEILVLVVGDSNIDPLVATCSNLENVTDVVIHIGTNDKQKAMTAQEAKDVIGRF